MRLFSKKQDEFVTIIFWQKHLTFCWIQQLERSSSLYLKAYYHVELTHSELDQLIIYNPTAIDQHIEHFFNTHNIYNPYVLFGIYGSQCIEKLVPSHTATPRVDQVTIPQSSDWQWDYHYLYPMEHGQYMFYASGIPKTVLFGFQLIALRNKLNVLKISPRTISLYQLYKYLYGSGYRNSQLGVHMQLHNNSIERFFTPDIIARIVHIPSSHGISAKSALPILAHACGLFVSERWSQ